MAEELQSNEERRDTHESGLKGAIERVSQRGAYGWVRLITLLVCGAIGGTILGNTAPDIMSLLFRTFQLRDFPPNTDPTHSPISTAGLVITGIFLGMFLGALCLNTFTRVGSRWDKMPV